MADERGLLANLGLLSYALMQLAGQAVDATVISPCAEIISTSVVNPYVWSERIWDGLKSYAPQRARDISRLLSLAIANSLHVLNTEKSAEWARTTSRLQSNAFRALSTPQGNAAIQDSVATVAKATQALGTPEVRAALDQMTATLKSGIQMLSTPEVRGQQMMEDAGMWASQCTEVISSPETSIFLFEVATNLCHVFTNPTDDRTPAERIAHLEATMLKKMGVVGPLGEPEQVLEEDPADGIMSQAFEGDDDDEGASPDDAPQWHPDVTHPNLRRRHQRQQIDQAMRNSQRPLRVRARVFGRQLRQRRRPSSSEPSAMDQLACKALSLVVVAFVAVMLLLVVLAFFRWLFV
ncbi:Aste57867_2244 [Aphanomyces stellatus]|uniref:Aste57867_2244 protein n=1 Tax=Aphanomyces stellatus TaxID=120398 RepID=A0A485K7U4_9STRA|nr:hypothetical protein As57867_002239 [Aphanomyces stellatus]VFT79447.1 Aste57867_2244 [Aphanomyces stellatus]